MKIKTYTINVKATFEGTVKVKANSKEDAKLFAQRDFSICFPNVRTSSDETIMAWDIGSLPTNMKFI
jgi:hypothetical protein